MAFKMNGFSGFKQKVKETEPTRNASQDPQETKADPNIGKKNLEFEEAKAAELERLKQKHDEMYSGKIMSDRFEYESGRHVTHLDPDPSKWGWENEPDSIVQITPVHGGHTRKTIVNPYGSKATSNKPVWGEDYLFESELKTLE